MPAKSDFDKFKVDLKKIEKKMRQDIADTKAWAAITYYSLIASIPVIDTGRYRASHQLELTRRSDSAAEGKTRSAYETEQAQQEQIVDNYRFDFKSGTFYIANNTEYSEILEAGRVGNKGSLKAPDGVYGVSYNRFEPMLRKKMAQLSKKVYK